MWAVRGNGFISTGVDYTRGRGVSRGSGGPRGGRRGDEIFMGFKVGGPWSASHQVRPRTPTVKV